jgi:hypothetical protein
MPHLPQPRDGMGSVEPPDHCFHWGIVIMVEWAEVQVESAGIMRP